MSNNVKRLRAERNQLRAKLETLTKGKEVSNDKSLNASTSASSGNGRSSDETNRDASNDVPMKPNESSLAGSRARPTRHHFEGSPSMHFVPETYVAVVMTQERPPLRDIQEPRSTGFISKLPPV